MSDFRIEKDSMGELQVPADALYAAQTQRAVQNFPISGITMPKRFIRALGLIKTTAAKANHKLGHLPEDKMNAIVAAAKKVADGDVFDAFPIDVFQTGSGTSSNMNSNEVIARLATTESGVSIHPNDDVNMGQSSNDVVPTAIKVSACLAVQEDLLPALQYLLDALLDKAEALENVVKTGRTHLMDAMPVTFGQELGCWASQVANAIDRIEDTLTRMAELPQGGTAVGTGINADPEFGDSFAAIMSELTDFDFVSAEDKFEGIATQDSAVELSGQLNVFACSLMKIANDLRWMNSGPLAGLGEIELTALQPGSSIMPGKVNPVICEAACMVAAQVMGNHQTITVSGQAGNFQLNVMLPVIAHNLLQSIEILANISRAMADDAIKGFTVREDNISHALSRNPILVTALNPVIGYEKGAAIAKQAYKEGRPVLDVAKDMTDLSEDELKKLLDPKKLTEGGINK